MATHRIAVIVGSLRKDSFNRKLADALADLAPASLAFEQVAIGALPLYNQDDDDAPAASVTAFKQQVAAADGFLFVTPEYNRSIPGVLKNALDHGSRPYGQSVWTGKPGAVLGVSPGAIGTAVAQQHLRTILAYLDVVTLGQPEVFLKADNVFAEGGGLSESSAKFLQKWMDRYAAWIARQAA